MEIIGRKGDVTKEVCDVLMFGVFQGDKNHTGAIADVNVATGGELMRVASDDKWKAKEGSTFLFRPVSGVSAKRVLLVGLGKRESLDASVIRRASASAFHLVKTLEAGRVVCVLFCDREEMLDTQVCAQAISEGARLAEYSFDKYKRKPVKNKVEMLEIVTSDGRLARRVQKGVLAGELASKGVIFARDLVNTSAAHMTPADLVDSAKEIGKGKGTMRVRVFEKDQLKKMGAGGILAVNQGSDHDPFLVHMIYKPTKRAKQRIILVGKAVTFDSGGLSLKPGNGMETMKCDMAGAATVLGVMSVIDQIAPQVEVHGIFGAVENMPSGTAIRPGDVITAMNKKTIEILNTDAEGRVTLADTLSYACKQKPTAVIDLATLTGACVVALGEEVSGLMSNNEELANALIDAADDAGEKFWELPLEKNYKKLIESDIADVKNIGGRYGGALTAGLFLQEFVKKGIPWAHIDIAGPAFAERPINSYEPKGATGHGVRTLIEFLTAI